MTALPAPTSESATASTPEPARDRIRGIDVARALAIIGMVMVHVGPFEPDTSTLGGQLYRLSYGRASVLFVLLAGVGITLLHRARGPRAALTQVAWRAIVFFPLGVALQALPTPVAVILQFYALYYLVGGVAALLPTRALTALALTWTAAGPLAFLVLADPQLAGRGTASAVSDPGQVVGDLLVTGYYPLLTWAPPLLVGLLVGRADLRDRITGAALLLGGSVVAAVAYGASEVAAAVLGGPVPDALLAEGHTGAPLNVAGASAVAVAVLGGCLLLARALPRATWPLTATGQMALTVYVGHLLVLAVAPALLEARQAVGPAAASVARFTAVTVVLCTAWRWRARRGPLEHLLALPFHARGRRPGTHTGGEADRRWPPTDPPPSSLPPVTPPPTSGPPSTPGPSSPPAPRPSPSWTPTSGSWSGTPPRRS